MKDKKLSQGFGGSLLKGANARNARPFSSKHALHLVLRSDIARGSLSMRHKKNIKQVDNTIKRQAAHWGVRIYKYANVGNHLHILLRPRSRRRLNGFTRSISGLIARKVMGAERGKKSTQKFWQARPFTRVVQWGAPFQRVKKYVETNIKEALGFLTPRLMRKMELHPKLLEELWPDYPI